MSEFIQASEVQDIYKAAMKELGRVTINEEDAKHGFMLTLASPAEGPTGLAVMGGTGGGKTSFLDTAHKLVRDIKDENVTDLPPQSDLRPVEVVGGLVKTTVVTEHEDGTSETESKLHRIEGKVHKDTQVLKLNELDTINPQTLNVIRELLASGKLVSTEGVIKVDGLLYFISTKNPLDNRNKFDASDAIVSRHAIGVYMGEDDEQNIDTVEQLFDGFEALKADEIEPVTDLKTIYAIRRFAKLGIAFPDSLKKESARRTVAASRTLKSRGIDDTPQRLSIQIMNTAKADAALHGETHLEKENIDLALRSALLARIGLRGSYGHMDIPSIVEEIVAG